MKNIRWTILLLLAITAILVTFEVSKEVFDSLTVIAVVAFAFSLIQLLLELGLRTVILYKLNSTRHQNKIVSYNGHGKYNTIERIRDKHPKIRYILKTKEGYLIIEEKSGVKKILGRYFTQVEARKSVYNRFIWGQFEMLPEIYEFDEYGYMIED
ncbi:MAG: hypothetical protein ACRC0V_05145 [Fusobacteriaceae bacterium]